MVTMGTAAPIKVLPNHNNNNIKTFMHLYSIFNLQLFLSTFFIKKNQSGIETPDRNAVCVWTTGQVAQ